MSKLLDKDTHDKVSFISFIITMFARAYKISKPNAYLFLKNHGGLDFLFEHWWTLHTEDEYWSLKELQDVCSENGGVR